MKTLPRILPALAAALVLGGAATANAHSPGEGRYERERFHDSRDHRRDHDDFRNGHRDHDRKAGYAWRSARRDLDGRLGPRELRDLRNDRWQIHEARERFLRDGRLTRHEARRLHALEQDYRRDRARSLRNDHWPHGR